MYQLLSLPVCPLDSHNIALSHCFSACSEDALNPPYIITFATRSRRHAFVTSVGCVNLLRSFQPVAPPQRNCHLHSGVMPSRVARVSSLPHQIHTTPHHRRRIVAGLCYDLSCKPWGLLIPRMLLLYARRPGVISRSPVLSPTSPSFARLASRFLPVRDTPGI